MGYVLESLVSEKKRDMQTTMSTSGSSLLTDTKHSTCVSKTLLTQGAKADSIANATPWVRYLTQELVLGGATTR